MTKLKKVKADYLAAIDDGTITDQEKQALADDLIAAIRSCIPSAEKIVNSSETPV